MRVVTPGTGMGTRFSGATGEFPGGSGFFQFRFPRFNREIWGRLVRFNRMPIPVPDFYKKCQKKV